MTPPDPMAGVLIRGAANGYGVADGVHDDLPVGGWSGVARGWVGLSDGRWLALFRGRGWWAGERRVGCVPGAREGWRRVERVRSSEVGWVVEGISGGRSVPRMML